MNRGVKHRIARLLWEIYVGEDRAAAARPRHDRRLSEYRPNLLVGEEGKISLVTVIVVMIFIVLIGLVANSGLAVVDKIELQNAADSTAYSTALWQARGMNAITTTNHLMGELTALLVIHEGLGGPTLEREGGDDRTEESEAMDDSIDDLKDEAPYGGDGFIAPLESVDEILLTNFLCTDLMMLAEKDGHTAGATLYDARLTLKNMAIQHMLAKKIFNKIEVVLEEFKTTWLGIIVAICDIGHVYASWEIAEIAKEWAYLKAVEIGARGFSISKDAIRRIIPLLSQYSDSVVGSGAPSGESAIARAQQQTLDEFQTWYSQRKVTSLGISPGTGDWPLPITAEPPPQNRDSNSNEDKPVGKTASLYGERYKPSRLLGLVQQAKSSIDDVIKEVEYFIDGLAQFGIPVENANVLSKVKSELTSLVADKFGIRDPVHDEDEWADDYNYPDNKGLGYGKNPSLGELQELDWRTEQKSQWVRGAYPYVDGFREPIVRWLKEHCRQSHAHVYYVNWTNRYTIDISHTIRTEGQNGSADSKEGPFSKIQEFLDKIEELRKKLDEVLEPSGDIDQNDPSISTKLDQVSSTLREYADRILEGKDELLSALRNVPGLEIDNWRREVENRLTSVQQDTNSATPPPELELDRQAYKEFVQDMELAARLDELLRVVERIAAKIKKTLNPLGGPAHMFVMRDMKVDLKGDEPWTRLPQQAEGYFTVIGVAYRAPQQVSSRLWFEPLFPNQHPKGTVAYAQAMLYNAGGRHLGGNAQLDGKQPNTGWDTLNWATPVRAPEWGSDPSSGASPSWDIFFGSSRTVYDGAPSYVRLNWQAKLIPITRIRMEQVFNDGELDSATRDALKPLEQSTPQVDLFDRDIGLVTH